MVSGCLHAFEWPKLTIYTEITQTSKMRKKEEFLRAFEPILAEAYKGSPADIQNKIRRVVEVWRQRNIFNPAVQQQVEKRINGMFESYKRGLRF
jgi:regulator of Ty1 transposition protein 103